MRSVRKASFADVPLVVSYIEKKAEFDRQIGAFNGALSTSVDRIATALFGVPVFAHAFVASLDGEPAGFAFFHYRFSSFNGRPSLWLDDLYIDASVRRSGCGVALMGALAREASLYACTHLAWTADDRNRMGVSFYRKLGASIASRQGHACCYSITPELLASRLTEISESRQTRSPMFAAPESPAGAGPGPMKFNVPQGLSTYKTLVAADTYRDGGSIEIRFACADGSFETLFLQASLDPQFGVRYIHTDLSIFADINRQGPSCKIAKNSAEEEAIVAAIQQFLRLPKVAVPFSHRTPDEHYLTTVEALLAGIPDRIPTEEGLPGQS